MVKRKSLDDNEPECGKGIPFPIQTFLWRQTRSVSEQNRCPSSSTAISSFHFFIHLLFIFEKGEEMGEDNCARDLRADVAPVTVLNHQGGNGGVFGGL